MNTTDGVRVEMLQRAARLSNSTETEEAWHLIGLFRETQPTTFLRICHRILASFLELTHDYFDQGWPLQSRLLSHSTNDADSLGDRNHRRGKTLSLALDNGYEYQDTTAIDHPLFSTCYNTTFQGHFLSSPFSRSSYMKCDSSSNLPSDQMKRQQAPNSLSKLKTITARRLFKQILPSKPTSVIHNGGAKSSQSEEPVVSRPFITDVHVSSCPGADTWMHPSVLSNTPIMKGILPLGSDTLNSTICRCLIEYMLDTPVVYSTEGLFRIPGNSQRIRDLWIQMQDFFQTPYIRIPQPEPENHDRLCVPPWDRWDVYEILGSFSPHDLASLLLRTIVTCSRLAPSSSSKYPPRHLWSDDFSPDSFGTHGLVHNQASELCFLATRLQYALNSTSCNLPCEDWMPILCQARQLLTYRIVLQLLLPSPERSILLGLLQLFNRVAKASATSRMSAECLARCAAVAVFGPPSVTNTPEQISDSASEENPLRWRIDTLTNLILMADQLSQLPELIYTIVRNRLRIRFGNSPIQRTPLSPSSVCNAPKDSSLNTNSHIRKRMRTANFRIDTEWVPESTAIDVLPTMEDTPPNLSSKTIHRTPARVSMHRSASTVEQPSSLRTPKVNKTRGLGGAEIFQFWRRQKITAVQQQLRTSVNRLPKVRSATTLKHGANHAKEMAI